MKKNLYYILYIAILTVFLAGCQDDTLFSTSADGPTNLRYTVKIDDQLKSRSIGDGTMVNNLTVLVFNQEGDLITRKDDLNWSQINESGLELSLFKGSYKVLFWLQYADENMRKPYTIADDGNVSVSYDGWTGNISDVEKWDAFSLVDDLTISSDPQTKPVKLVRPVGQLNWATKDEFNPEDHQVKVTLNNVATTFNPFTNTAIGNKEVSFIFNDFTEETLTTTGGETYTYLTCNYLFPATLTATFDLQQKNGTSVKNTGQLDNIVIAKNMRTNVLGSIAQAPETGDGAWDGLTFEEPTQDEENRYIIDKPSKLAWLASAENNLTEAATFLVTEDLDMASIDIASVKLPAGSTFDGGSKTIMNFANSLFGNATNLTVQNLNLDNVQASSDGHVGVLVNTLTGSSTFKGVTITNSSATTTDGAAGGMIGYITNKEGETLEVTFSGCTATNNKVNGSITSGVYVGRFRGYNNSETLTFSSCNESSATIMGANPYYVEGNEAIWLAENDYSDYSGWLGNEEYYRGTVRFGYVDENNIGIQFIPKWDGKTAVEPIYQDNDKKIAYIYSPFDLAYLQGKSLTTLNFKENVDLGGGSCEDCITADSDELCTNEECNHFTPIVSLNNLIGNEKTLYNLNVQGVHVLQDNVNYGMGFICQTKAGKFENFTFDGAIIRCIDIIGLRNDVNDGGNAYAGTLTSRVEGKMTINNVHAKNGRVIGISKFGGLIGYVPGGIDATGCTVDNYVIENHKINVINSYEENVHKTFTIPIINIPINVYASCKEDFYTEGEVGGFIGFISSSASIKDCHVTNTTMKCYGQDNKKTWIKGGLSQNAQINIMQYEIAGRHVNTFIGDIRTTATSTKITIDDCSADETNKYEDNYDMDITKTGNGELVGCCYFVGKTVKISSYEIHVGDYQGTVIINGESMPFVGG